MNGSAGTPDQIVKAEYKTGEYIGKVVETDGRRALVQVLAVLRHPTQGDLHHPYDPDPPLFHERRASAYNEKIWVPVSAMKPYDGAIPPYKESLLAATGAEMEKLERLQRWAGRSLERLQGLLKEYEG
ncbi:kinase-associated lipoprotein B [Cohnella thermotolerans]|uniref:kinase-associated lipoprotein B n=1 Tax=Cohnella thermotolerans TaxID=329858 RepID=UPI00040CB0BE|nr:kinase-associated lipoprotein B [Cohnella thermotolerans]